MQERKIFSIPFPRSSEEAYAILAERVLESPNHRVLEQALTFTLVAVQTIPELCQYCSTPRLLYPTLVVPRYLLPVLAKNMRVINDLCFLAGSYCPCHINILGFEVEVVGEVVACAPIVEQAGYATVLDDYALWDGKRWMK